MDLTAAAYQSVPGGPLDVDRAFYTAIRDRSPQQQSLVEDLTVPIRSGRAWVVPAGHVCRITTIEGPQVADLNVWNLADPRGEDVRSCADPSAPGRARHRVRPARGPRCPLLLADGSDSPRRLAARLRRRLGGRPRPRTAGHPLRPLRQPDARGRGFRLPLPLEPHPRHRPAFAHGVRRPRRPQRLPVHRPQRPR